VVWSITSARGAVSAAGAVRTGSGPKASFFGLVIFTKSPCGGAGRDEVLWRGRSRDWGVMIRNGAALISRSRRGPTARTNALAPTAQRSVVICARPLSRMLTLVRWRAIFLVTSPAQPRWITYSGWLRVATQLRRSICRAAHLIGGCSAGAGLLRGISTWEHVTSGARRRGGLLSAFVVVEERSREPMPPRLLRERRFAGPQVAVFRIAASSSPCSCIDPFLQTVSPAHKNGLCTFPHLPGVHRLCMTAQFGAKFSPAKVAAVGLALSPRAGGRCWSSK